jgi:hypothetical protein
VGKVQEPSDTIVEVLHILEAMKDYNFELMQGNDLFRSADGHGVYFYQWTSLAVVHMNKSLKMQQEACSFLLVHAARSDVSDEARQGCSDPMAFC